ncbi:MAG: N-6 DNA methylase [Rhodobacteraceae bacterium]|nr:N-6 DNA methylase [Paracoccaceae bacterium]MCY4250864.1 N-6 DNA methylase [Paracoccaceae bacterium]
MYNDKDFCTGKSVDFSKPEEPVRQETEKWLVLELGYDKDCMDIELRIRAGSKHLKPDILVLNRKRASKIDQQKDIVGMVETKPDSMEQAEKQLLSCMAVSSSCEWGVAATKNARQFYRRHSNGQIERIHTIPISGMSIDQVVRLKKSDLKPAVNLKLRFKSILYHLYSNTNIQSRTRLCNEMTKILFCKIYDERSDLDVPVFQCTPQETRKEVKFKIEDKLWKPVLTALESTDVFDENERMILDEDSVAYVVGELERVSLLKTEYDVIGAAFEVFAERYFVGEKGEFFTPRVAVTNAIKLLDPSYAKSIIDPACGSGGFLIQALKHVWDKIEENSINKDQEKKQAPNYIFGIDKEPDLVKVARSYMALIGDGHTSIVDADSLKPANKWSERSRVKLTNHKGELKQFDMVVTNPPFGSNIFIEHPYILKSYELGHSWVRGNNLKSWIKENDTVPTAPQILFLELCVKLLKAGGFMCIVLPEGIFGNPTEGYVRQWLLDNVKILAVWDCPQSLFLPHTNTKTCMLFVQKEKTRKQKILMSVLRKTGHDQRGAEIMLEDGRLDEDFSIALEDWKSSQNDESFYKGKISHIVAGDELDEENRLVPRLHLNNKIEFSESYMLGDLEIKGTISIKTVSCNVRQNEYTSDGKIPFVRTSDVGVMELRPPPQKSTNRGLRQSKIKPGYTATRHFVNQRRNLSNW